MEDLKLLPKADPAQDVDADLIERCRAELPHQTEAYYELLQKYEKIVYGTCFRMLGNQQEAEEACQDSFLRVFHKLYQFEGRSTFKTWLFRIVYNFCMTRRRKLATKRERDHVIGDELVRKTKEFHREATDPGVDHMESVYLALNQMKDGEREIITLRFISDLSLEEMAGVLELKLSATKMRLYRAMDRFKEIYANQALEREEDPA